VQLSRPRPFAIAGVLVALAACSGSVTNVVSSPEDASDGHAKGNKGGNDGGNKGDTGAETRDTGSVTVDATAKGDAVSPPSDADVGPLVYVRLAATQAPFGTTSPGAPQETPVDQHVGVLGLTLRTSAGAAPLVLTNNSQPIDAPCNAGSTTLLGTIPASALVAGHYTIARVPVAYVKFTVAGTYHYDSMAIPGDFTDLIALTAGFSFQGAVRDRGWWSSSFAVAGVTEGAVTGENAEIAQPGPSSGISLDLSTATAEYVFPVSLDIPASITTDTDVVFTINTYQDFHWTDQSDPGYAPGVFDVEPGAFEPVTQLGANSFAATIAPGQ